MQFLFEVAPTGFDTFRALAVLAVTTLTSDLSGLESFPLGELCQEETEATRARFGGYDGNKLMLVPSSLSTFTSKRQIGKKLKKE